MQPSSAAPLSGIPVVTYLLVPPWSDQAGQFRIVAREGDWPDALSNYRSSPEPWREVGKVSSRGSIVCLDAPAAVYAELRACAPLRPPLVIRHRGGLLPAHCKPGTFLVASLRHTGPAQEHIIWWGHDQKGYTPVVGDYVGCYSLEVVNDRLERLNDGIDTLAVPVEAVARVLSQDPTFEDPPRRFYDQRGPVVGNTSLVWKALIKASEQAALPGYPTVGARGVRPRTFTHTARTNSDVLERDGA